MTLRFCKYEIDVERRELRRARVSVHVEPQVFDLLVYLVQNRDRVVSRMISSRRSGAAGSCRIRP
jgi:DNA-binding winged helix-turn-helix (wHTH) protein